jgi:hypothetical protein
VNAVVEGSKQGEFMAYDNTWLDLRPGAVIEKDFTLQVYPVAEVGSGFRHAAAHRASKRASALLHRRHSPPPRGSSSRSSRSHARAGASATIPDSGFEMYPDYVQGTHYVMGWCGQAETVPYYLLAAGESGFMAELASATRRRALDLLVTAPFNENGFLQRYTAENGQWTEQDFVSQGQALESISLAIEAANRRGLDTSRWTAFLRRACELHANRVTARGLEPRLDQRGVLCLAALAGSARLLNSPLCERGAMKIADHRRDAPHQRVGTLLGRHARRPLRGQGGRVGRVPGVPRVL